MTGRDAQAANPFAAGCAWIDGQYLPVAEARIPILDTGFVRSDLSYDVVAVWEGGSSGWTTTWTGCSPGAAGSGSLPRSPRRTSGRS